MTLVEGCAMHDESREAAGEPGARPDAEEAVLLLTTWDDGEAAIVRQLLEGAGIPTQVVSDVPHSVWPITVDGLGEVRVLVPAGRVDEARALLKDHRRQGREVSSGEANEP
jgi:hypothetical protein